MSPAVTLSKRPPVENRWSREYRWGKTQVKISLACFFTQLVWLCVSLVASIGAGGAAASPGLVRVWGVWPNTHIPTFLNPQLHLAYICRQYVQS